ncbi:MAG: TetR family transcriptional regulator [Clostridiales bacterium]|nr:TetR family transcriptional regulator [Clostridiales bacterium]
MSDLTKNALAESLTLLLEERPLDKITIKDITGRCGVTRNTFYYHFSDVYGLLSWIFEKQADEIVKMYPDVNEEGFLYGLNYLYENRKMIYNVYFSISREELSRYINTVTEDYALRFVEVLTRDIDVSEEARVVTADFYKNALVGAIFQWIQGRMSTSPKALAALYDSMFRGTVKQAIISAENGLQ